MSTICAWCGRKGDGGPDRDGSEATHGICDACRSRLEPENAALELAKAVIETRVEAARPKRRR